MSSHCPVVRNQSQRQRWASRRVPAFDKRRVAGSARTLVCKAPTLTDDVFESEVLQADVPVLVDFYAEWCGPCKLIAPLIDWAANEFSGKMKVYKLDTDTNPKFLTRYGISGLPTLILMKKGDVVARHEGAIGKPALTQFLTENLPELVP
jgi:thioredoxin 1